MDNANLSMLEHIMELLDAEGEESFFGAGRPADRLILRPHQQVQAGLSTARRVRAGVDDAKEDIGSVG